MYTISSLLKPLLLALIISGGCAWSSGAQPVATAIVQPDATQLPALASLPDVAVKAEKHASSLDYELLDQAPVLQSALGTAWSEGNLALTPPDAKTMAWAVFGLGGLPTNGTVYPVRVVAVADAQYWLAVSDYAKQHWVFLPYQASGIYAIADGANLISPGGTFYLALVAWQQPSSMTGLLVTTNAKTHELWYYLQTNLQVDANLATEIARLKTAADAGYTRVLYADSKLDYIDTVWSHYIDNLQAFNAAAQDNGIEVIPAMCSVGYADAMLMHDPNLIEGQPVKDCEFLVGGGQAQVVQDPATVITNGDFETHTGDTFAGWNQMDIPGESTFADTGRTGGTSIRYSNYSGNDRISQQFTVQPWHYYVVHFWLKTQGVDPVNQLWARIFSADTDFRQLTYNTFPISQTQDWTQYHLIFNSQEKTQVYLYLGIWGGEAGSFWIDDVSVENAGLCNLVRRPGAPFSVTSADGGTTYTEGSDYDPVSDPGMGNVAGYPGTYDLWHAPPAISIPGGSRIRNGDRLKVSYYHAAFTDDGKTAIALSEEATFTIVQNLLQAVHTAIQPKTVMIAVDEHRVGGWSEPGFSAGATTGQLLAQFTRRAEQIARQVDPALRLIVWSDMYDPYHNMVPAYYLCRGGTLDASDGLSPEWDVANWHFFAPDAAAALAYFSNRGNRQILSGYYDEGSSISIGGWLDMAQGVPGVYAVMYTTWANDYSQLTNFAGAVRAWESANP